MNIFVLMGWEVFLFLRKFFVIWEEIYMELKKSIDRVDYCNKCGIEKVEVKKTIHWGTEESKRKECPNALLHRVEELIKKA
ncbi:hypothetical protein A2Z53_01670 [Candidatus Giovannonibacteria bacterium RIFCSPHIGHO2_02_42_15]|uniref:Uncharacterized protein n=2 Tax=Candidatus Giovannoniibacteriota TaxID=1752738 RepID=A0A1F5VPH8_9BACT|nr:MAG: hypothetical protein A2Z53_01670 [Candidatus Giovannonibacteria bacterium RIFCSPHIGHO2_02_42_15]